MGRARDEETKYVRVTGLWKLAESDKAYLLAVPDVDEDADPPEKVWWPKSQARRLKVVGTRQYSGKTIEAVAVDLAEWLLKKKYESADLGEGYFDDLIEAEGKGPKDQEDLFDAD